jgi:hypothetical protein
MKELKPPLITEFIKSYRSNRINHVLQMAPLSTKRTKIFGKTDPIKAHVRPQKATTPRI